MTVSLPKLSLKTEQLKHLMRWLPLGLLLGFLGLTAFAMLFLYRNFYLTIAQVKVVAILRSQVALNEVNLPLFDQVFKDWDLKKTPDPKAAEIIRDPFVSVEALKTLGTTETPTPPDLKLAP